MPKQKGLNPPLVPPGGRELPAFEVDPSSTWEEAWIRDRKGPETLKKMLNGQGQGPSGGPEAGGNGTKNGKKNGNGNGRGNGGGGGGGGPLPPPDGGPRHHTTYYGPPEDGSGGNGPNGPKGKGRKVPWGKIGHIAKEAAMYGTGAAYGRYRYREWKEEGDLSEGRAQEMAKDVLGREKFIPGIEQQEGVFTYYDLLGVSKTATTEQIHTAWKARAAAIYPMVGGAISVEKTPETEEAMRLINEAKYHLIDQPQPSRRNAYNQKLIDEEMARAQRGEGTTLPPEHTWEELPGSYKKRFRGQAREQLRKEKEIYSEARRLGIPTTQPGMKKSWQEMSQSEREQFEAMTGRKMPTDFKGRQELVTVQAGKKAVGQLEREVEAQKGTVAKLQAEKGLQEMAAREASPDKRKKAIGYASQAAGVVGKIGKGAGGTAVGKRVRSVSGATDALTAVQAGAPSALRGPVAMGAGSLRGAVAGGRPQRVVAGSQSVAGLMTAAPQELKAVTAAPAGGSDLKSAIGGSDRLAQSIRTRTSQPRLPRAGVGPLRQQPPFTGRPVAGLPGRKPKVKRVTGSRTRTRKQIAGRI